MLSIDKNSRKPIYEQIVESVEREIASGILKENDKLPSIRDLSLKLSINPNTIQKAFIELDRRGIIISYPGRGCFVAPEASDRLRTSQSDKLQKLSELASQLYKLGLSKEEIINAVSKACIESSTDNRKENTDDNS